MTKYTPGPWKFASPWVQTVDDKTPIANFNFYAAKEDNARLIAAAPDLLEAAKFALTIIGERNQDTLASAEAQLRDAIAKAEGKQEAKI
jgi:hypothetical protein